MAPGNPLETLTQAMVVNVSKELRVGHMLETIAQADK
jgi:hypothetical protein